MAWPINCSDAGCGKETWATNIVELITSHRDDEGWLVCQCGMRGYVKKSFEMQEAGEPWEPYLRAIIPLGATGDIYQPFVFVVSYQPDGPPDGVWFSYYKDLRPFGGRLKLGYGPGGPPVLDKTDVLRLVRNLRDIGCLSETEIQDSLK